MASSTAKDDFYKLLGVAYTATLQEITRSYRKLALYLHPDKNLHNPKAKEAFQELGNAYDTLKDAGLRAAYDRAHAVPVPARSTANPPQAQPVVWPSLFKYDLFRKEGAEIRARISVLQSSKRDREAEKAKFEQRIAKIREELAFFKKQAEDEARFNPNNLTAKEQFDAGVIRAMKMWSRKEELAERVREIKAMDAMIKEIDDKIPPENAKLRENEEKRKLQDVLFNDLCARWERQAQETRVHEAMEAQAHLQARREESRRERQVRDLAQARCYAWSGILPPHPTEHGCAFVSISSWVEVCGTAKCYRCFFIQDSGIFECAQCSFRACRVCRPITCHPWELWRIDTRAKRPS